MTVVISGRLDAISEKTMLTFPNGETPMVTMQLTTRDGEFFPVEVFGDKKLEYISDKVGRNGDFVCNMVANHYTFTNSDGDEVTVNHVRLRLKTALFDWN